MCWSCTTTDQAGQVSPARLLTGGAGPFLWSELVRAAGAEYVDTSWGRHWQSWQNLWIAALGWDKPIGANSAKPAWRNWSSSILPSCHCGCGGLQSTVTSCNLRLHLSVTVGGNAAPQSAPISDCYQSRTPHSLAILHRELNILLQILKVFT